MEEAQIRCEKEGIAFWKAVQLEDAGERQITEEDSWNVMTLFCFFIFPEQDDGLESKMLCENA